MIAKTKKHRRCLGYGEFWGKCDNEAGTPWGAYFCWRCDKLRLAAIQGSLVSVGEMLDATRDEVIQKYGVDPEKVGNRPRGWWIVNKVRDEEVYAGAQIGDLCVQTRDGATNPIDPEAAKVGSYVGSQEDGFDHTYRYYYYRRKGA